MSGCNHRLGAYLDGELGPQDRAAVESHVESCAACRGELEGLRAESDGLRRALGGLLLHVDLPGMVMRELPEKRRSMIMTRTQGVRRRLALIGFGVAAAFIIGSFIQTGPHSVMMLLSESQRTALYMNWALAIVAGSMLIWPETIAGWEARALSFLRARDPRVAPGERALVQGVGLVFLCVSTAVHYLLMRNLGL